jgi:hypothetical protein
MIKAEKVLVNNLTQSCPICDCQKKKIWIEYSDEFQISECLSCGLGFVDPYLDINDDSYIDYGDYITKLSVDYFKNRNRVSKAKYAFFSVLKLLKSNKIRILDYGGGAGFFISSAIKMGFEESYLFEPSENFRKAAVEKVGLPSSRVKASFSDVDFKIDFVCMMDVIEHLPEANIHTLLDELTTQMADGAILFGETPNKNSFNIFLHGKRDPVVALPGHVLYFTKRSLDTLLKRHGFKKKFLFTKGFSHNSFFRSEKFRPSFVESPIGARQKILSKLIKLYFGIGSFILSPFGLGYHLIFAYELKKKTILDRKL